MEAHFSELAFSLTSFPLHVSTTYSAQEYRCPRELFNVDCVGSDLQYLLDIEG
jgi:hypothetical protein